LRKSDLPFFGATCRRTLGSYLEESGFTEKGQNEIGGLVFSRFVIFLEIYYELETAPHYAVSVVLGTGENNMMKGVIPVACLIGICFREIGPITVASG
jgi:hypothetical protein